MTRRLCFVALLSVLVAGLAIYISKSKSSSLKEAGARMGDGEMFDRIAHFYDTGNLLISAGLHLHWKRELLKAMNVSLGSRLLDVATGTGDVAILASTEFGVKHTVAIDPSSEMLARAKIKAATLSIHNEIAFTRGDGQNMTRLIDSQFDRVAIAFGIRNIPDRDATLREIWRVLESGGICGILELGPPSNSLLGDAAAIFTQYAVPLIGYLLGSDGNEYEYLQESVFNFPTTFDQQVRRVGFELVSTTEYLGGIVKLFIARK